MTTRPTYRRVVASHSMKTLVDILPKRQNVPSAIIPHKRGELIDADNSMAMNFETFIVAKKHGEAYFRTNPPWIARFVISKFRKLLMKLKDESLCIDYTLMQVKMETFDKKYRPLSDANERNLNDQTLLKPDKRRYSSEITYTTNKVLGATAPSASEQNPFNSSEIYKKKTAQHRKDRGLIKKTLTTFPFPDLRIHDKGFIRFADVIRYFVHELKCERLRTWVENDEEFSELSIPPLVHEFVFSEANDPSRPKYKTPLRQVVPAHWLGEKLRPYDVALCHINSGGNWTGHVSSFGHVGVSSDMYLSDKQILTNQRRTTDVSTQRKFWWQVKGRKDNAFNTLA